MRARKKLPVLADCVEAVLCHAELEILTTFPPKYVVTEHKIVPVLVLFGASNSAMLTSCSHMSGSGCVRITNTEVGAEFVVKYWHD